MVPATMLNVKYMRVKTLLHTIKINVIPMGILGGAYSMSGFLQHVIDIPDSQLDSGTS